MFIELTTKRFVSIIVPAFIVLIIIVAVQVWVALKEPEIDELKRMLDNYIPTDAELLKVRKFCKVRGDISKFIFCHNKRVVRLIEK